MLRELAIRTLFHDRGKLVAGLIGVVFSVVLVNVQGGLFLGLIRKASLLIDRSEADIWIGHRGMHNVDFPHSIPERWRRRVESVPGVKEVAPLRIGFSEISLPDGHYEGVVVVGIDRASSMGHVYGDLTGDPDPLAGVDSVVVDACDAEKLQHPELGELREIGGRRVRITSNSYGILSFLVTPYVFTDYEHAATLTPIQPGEASYLLARVQAGVDADATCEEIMRRLPDVTAMPSTTFADVSVKFWMTRTGLGISFGASTMLGLLVGLVMVGQTLYAMVL
ncbi:MAG: ABC transporter permease, partial [Planctomycetota bacterium]